MSDPSPIHRNPDTAGEDFGCVGSKARKGNRSILQFVESVERDLRARLFINGDELIDHARYTLEEIDRECDCGACDTVVKENVFSVLAEAIEDANLADFDRMQIYGW